MNKLLIVNLLIFFLLITLIEVIFGFWLKKENFGYLMRKNRNQIQDYQIKFDDKVYKHRYKRNFHGFRGDEVDPSEIKIVFIGGSTGNQRFTPEEFTIVERLNQLLGKKSFNHKIYNASTDGKSTFGIMNDFEYWFPKLEKFNPKFFIFYIGLNDKFYRGNCKLDNSKHFDHNDCMMDKKLKNQVEDYVKNNSIIYLLTKRIKHKYFPENKIRYDFFGYKASEGNSLYKNFSYLDYRAAYKIYKNYPISSDDKFVESELKKRIAKLLDYTKKYDAEILLITQVQFDGVRDLDLFKANNTIKEFSRKNKINLIPLDERIIMKINDFYDPWHTTLIGSERIAKNIFPEIYEIISKKLD
tara:strand:- start:7623 stop:8690 length:1068 start_codon:yes stop_codon:yes gene_type:complete